MRPHRLPCLCLHVDKLARAPSQWPAMHPPASMMRATSSDTSPSRADGHAPGLFPMHVLGAGPIGLLYASAMHRAYYSEERCGGPNRSGHPVTLLARSHHKPHLKWHSESSGWRAPVTISGPSKAAVSKCDIPVELVDAEEGGHPPIRRLLLCTKANDAIMALDGVWDRLAPSPSSSDAAKVIVLCNGALAVRDAICERFGEDIAISGKSTEEGRGVEIALATTTHGAYRTQQSTDYESAGQYDVTHAGLGSTHCTDREFVRMCQSIGWQAKVLSELEMNIMLWMKLAVNCVVNPLTAIYGVKNGQLLGFEHQGQDVKTVTRQILEEVSRVALLSMETHLQTAEVNGKGSDALLQSAREPLSVPSLEAFVFQVIADTAGNISSMLQDVRAKRRTEVRSLNGYVSMLGQERYGMGCPWNSEMCQQVENIKR